MNKAQKPAEMEKKETEKNLLLQDEKKSHTIKKMKIVYHPQQKKIELSIWKEQGCLFQRRRRWRSDRNEQQ